MTDENWEVVSSVEKLQHTLKFSVVMGEVSIGFEIVVEMTE